MHVRGVLAGTLAAAALGVGGGASGGTHVDPRSLAGHLRPTLKAAPVWADEFDGPAGALPSSARWTQDWGGLGWGDGELQAYTDERTENVHTDGAGLLHLVARREAAQEPWSGGAQFTSARITTQGRYTLRYGRVEARIKVPAGQGLWPAFWLLGADAPAVGWPACGELDVVETVGGAQAAWSHVHGATTTGAAWSLGGARPALASYAGAFHVYAMDWRADRITFTVDGQTVVQVSRSALPEGAVWPFDKPHYLLLDLAVGGAWPGAPDASTPFPADMSVDYVWVYA